MVVTRPVQFAAALYVIIMLWAAAGACNSPRPAPAPAPALAPATPLPAGALQVSRALLPVVVGWGAPWAERTATPRPTPRPTAGVRDALIAEVVGFARTRGVDGAGLRGASCVVTSMAKTGPGTLADCLTRAGRWITFSKRGRIVLEDDLAVPSNTTIDAAGAGVELYGHGLTIHRSQNVIIAGLAITECAEDAIQVTEHAQGVFLTGLVLSACGDGLVDITDGATDVTLANSTLRDHSKAMLIGASDGHTADAAIWVTIANTIFATTYRHPMCRYGYVHLDRVTIGPWQGDAVDARLGCRVLITRSWFVPGPSDKPALAVRLDYGPGSGGAARIVDTHLGGKSAQLGGDVPDPVYGVLR